jgi:hypothetical protein
VNREQRQRQMLASLPLMLQEGASIGELFAALARMLSGEPEDGGVEYGITRLLRSRWHRLAQGWSEPEAAARDASELGRLGALFGFPPARGEQVDPFRRRLREFVAIHRAGLTTTPAILRLVALVYQAEATPVITWDTDGRVAQAEFVARGPSGEPGPVVVELIDNPTATAISRFTAVPAGHRLVVHNAGLDPAIPEIRLRPVAAPAKVPVFIHAESGLRLIYVGVVAAGKTLTLRHQRPPLIDGVPQVDVPVLLTNPFTFDAPNARFAGPDEPGARYSVAQRDATLPTLEPGESAWTYDAMARDELAAFLGAWPPLVPLAKQADVVPSAPVADIELRWDEAVPASIALRIPADHVPDAFAGDLAAFVRELEWALGYGRAAGVRTRVELAMPHVHERLEIVDELTILATGSFAEAETIVEFAPAPTPGIGLKDTLDEPADALSFGGIFDITPFETSLFT